MQNFKKITKYHKKYCWFTVITSCLCKIPIITARNGSESQLNSTNLVDIFCNKSGEVWLCCRHAVYIGAVVLPEILNTCLIILWNGCKSRNNSDYCQYRLACLILFHALQEYFSRHNWSLSPTSFFVSGFGNCDIWSEQLDKEP